MKYNININQKAISKLNKSLKDKLDLKDAAILEWLTIFNTEPKIDKKLISNKLFFWASYQYIINENPLLFITDKEAIAKRILKLIDAGLIEKSPSKMHGNKTFFHITQYCFDKIIRSPLTDENREPLTDENREPLTDENRDNNNTNKDHSTIDKEKGEIKNSPELFEEELIVSSKKKKLSEIKESEIPSKDLIYYKTADAFLKLFSANLKQLGIPLNNLNKANYKWIDTIRLMFTTDGYTQKDFRDVYEFLQKDEFWKSNVQSVPKLREKMQTIITQARKTTTPKTTGVILNPMTPEQKAYHKMREQAQTQA